MLKKIILAFVIFFCYSGNCKNHNWKLLTLGGLYFWTDVKVNSGCRIQKHVWTGHYRVLDEKNCRHAWGKYEDCLSEYQLLTEISSSTKKALLVHGLTVKKDSLKPLQESLEEQGYEVEYFRFSCFAEPLEETSKSLAEVLDSYKKNIDVITHSTGAILIRQYEKDFESKGINRIVMLAAPNNGVVLVNCLKKIGLAGLSGINGKRLYEGEGSLPETLPEPSVDFITISGRNDGLPYFPLSALKFNHDGLLSTDTGALKSAQMNYTVKAHHFTIMEKNEVKTLIKDFLKGK